MKRNLQNKYNLKKIVIGTAQLGMNYGISNKNGEISLNEMQKIIDLCKKNSINTLDTAIDYGKSEKKLGDLKIKDFKMITKIANLNKNNTISFVENEIKNSIKRLKISKLDTLLLHTSDDLRRNNKEEIYYALQNCKDIGFCKKIGISAYQYDQVNEIIDNFKIDVVQFPFNILNGVLIKKGLLNKLKEKNIEVHVRSVFMQGLLLMQNQKRNEYFKPWNNLFNDWEEWLISNKFSALETCINYPFNFKEIDKVIIGVESYIQLNEIIKSILESKVKLFPQHLSSTDEALINPSLWKLK